jgi:ATP-binding cassette, subfamily F, member 3
VAYQRPNLLLLDEPTNHLDLEMRQALAVALQDYEGAVVLVSHDRHLLSTVVDEFRLVAHGRAEPFEGDLDDYARWLANGGPPLASQGAAPAPIASPAAPSAESADTRKRRKRAEAQQRASLSPVRAAIAEHERQLERLSAERLRLDHALIEAAATADAALGAKLRKEQAKVIGSIASVEAAWMQATERLEALAKNRVQS